MFDHIAWRYDFLNHFLSLGTDYRWRKKLVQLAKNFSPLTILDVATGTADLAINLAESGFSSITGIDISEGMLAVGREKIQKRNLEHRIQLIQGDAENLAFTGPSFDLITAAFGVRNFENLDKGLKEMNRVLRPGGHVLILEFSTIENPIWKALFQFYFRWVLPVFGKIISRHSFAYSYLPDSVGIFPYGKEFLTLLTKAGFDNNCQRRLSGGIATIYTGEKK